MDDRMIIVCADVIATSGDGRIVIVERIEQNNGLALPGGKKEHNEFLSMTACREMHEETGMSLGIQSVLGTYAQDDRDPRGRFVSTVFVGVASGDPCDEKGKTRVVLMTREEIIARKRDFLFDHFDILSDYFKLCDPRREICNEHKDR